jgi:signal transduction histidine kinase
MPNVKKSRSRQDNSSGQVSETLAQRVGDDPERQQSASERSIRAVQRLSVLGEMTGGITHDFRNILAVIDSGLRLVEKSSHDLNAACTFIAGIREAVARGLTLTSQLLSFAKQGELQACEADVNNLLKALELFVRYSAGPEVRVLLELSPDVPNCLIDTSQFNAAILNLVINARDAMPKGGEIRISTTPWVADSDVSNAKPGDYVRVRVRDNGLGMPEDILEKIFQPFFTTKGEQGTGLGVPQIGAFMRYIGGHICVASDPGGGTTFDLFFPVAGPNGASTRRIEGHDIPVPRRVSELPVEPSKMELPVH